MNNEVVGILIGVIVVMIATYKMRRMPGSNRKYITLAMIGGAILLTAFALKRLSEPFSTLSYPVGIAGWVIGCVFLYKNYKYRTSSDTKKHKKSKKR